MSFYRPCRLLFLAVVVLPSLARSVVTADNTLLPKEQQVVAQPSYEGASVPVTLSNGSGDGSVQVTVDGYGSFGQGTPMGDPIYDPIGPTGPAGTVFESGVFFGPLGGFLTTDTFGPALPPVDFQVVTPTLAQSEFDIANFNFQLTQRLTPIGPSGSLLIQEYLIRNNSGSNQSINLLRHLDGDLDFDGSISDLGAATSGGRVLFEFDSGDNPAAPVTYVGISSETVSVDGFTIQPYNFVDDIISSSGIPPSTLNQVFNDTDGDLVSDLPFDVTLSLEESFDLAAGESRIYRTLTAFGNSLASSVALEVLDPNCDQVNRCNGAFLEAEGDSSAFVDSDPERLALVNIPRTGASSDGTTLLLLRARCSDSTIFSLELSGGDMAGPEWGQLYTRQGDLAGNEVSVRPVTTSLGSFCFAVYEVPDDFPESIAAISLAVNIIATNSSGSATVPLQLVPPSVVLVHGLWSGLAAWEGFDGYLTGQGFRAARADYEFDNAGSFDPTLPSRPIDEVVQTTAEALSELRQQGLATSRVDVVGHSMGGLIARARVRYQRPIYRQVENRFRGSFRKVLTVGTPHHGSPIADILLENRCETIFFKTLEERFADQGRRLGPAVFQLQTNSKALERIGATDSKALPIIGVEAAEGSDVETFFNEKILDRLDNVEQDIDEILGGNQNHDTLVTIASQQGGMSSPPFDPSTMQVNGIVHANIDQDSTDPSETDSVDVWQVLENLLIVNSVSDFGTFPVPSIAAGLPITLTPCPDRLALPIRDRGTAVILPVAGTTFVPGELVNVTLTLPEGTVVGSAPFAFGNSWRSVLGGTPSVSSVFTALQRVGRINIFVDAEGSDGTLYSEETYIIVQTDELPISLRADPSSVSAHLAGQVAQLRIFGDLSDGSSVELTSAEAGTVYSTLSGTNEVASVSSSGLLTIEGGGQDTVIVEHDSGLSTAVFVQASVTNLPPAFSISVNDQRFAAGQTRVIILEATDPDGDDLAFQALEMPSFALLNDNTDGTAVVEFMPTVADIGAHSVLVSVQDTGSPRLGEALTFSVEVLPNTPIFVDGFESGGTSEWSATVP